LEYFHRDKKMEYNKLYEIEKVLKTGKSSLIKELRKSKWGRKVLIIDFLFKVLHYLPYIGLAIYIVRILIMKFAPAKVPKGKKLTKKLLLSCIEQLKKNDKKIHDSYKADEEILCKLREDKTDPYTLKLLLNDICEHVGLSGELFTLKVKNTVVSDRAGEIRPGVSNINITLDLKREYDIDAIISVLAHEVMHQYLFFKGIKRRDRWENEILTDTAVVYCGFYSYMISGYAPKHGVNPFAYTKVGYISTKDIEFIKNNI